MNSLLVHLLAGISLALSATLSAEEVWVHFAGHVKKPGVYKVSSPATVEDLEKACGGWTEFGAANRLTVIRLERQANRLIDDLGEPESKIYRLPDVPREDEKLILKKDDIIFIPEKRVVGR